MGQLAAVSRRFVEAFNARRGDDVDEFIDEHYVDHHVPDAIPRGPEGVRVWFGILYTAFDGRIDVDDVIETGDKVASRWRFSGTHVGEFAGIAATGRTFSAEFMSIERFEDGRIVERWEVGDVLGILRQLGAVPG
jgi:predicted ester cyclase